LPTGKGREILDLLALPETTTKIAVPWPVGPTVLVEIGYEELPSKSRYVKHGFIYIQMMQSRHI